MKLQGRNIVVMADDIAIAASKACEITSQADLIEKASPTSGKAREFVLGRTGWKITITKYLFSVKTDILRVGKKVKLLLASVIDSETGRVLSTDRMVGEAFCTTCIENGTVGSLATGTLEFIGTGELLPSTEPVPEPEPEPTPEPTPEPEPEPEMPVKGLRGATVNKSEVDNIPITEVGEVLAMKLKPGVENFIKVITGPEYDKSKFMIHSDMISSYSTYEDILQISPTRGLPDGTVIEIYYDNQVVAIGIIENIVEQEITVKWYQASITSSSSPSSAFAVDEISPSPCPRDILVYYSYRYKNPDYVIPEIHEEYITANGRGLIPMGSIVGENLNYIQDIDHEGANAIFKGTLLSITADHVTFIRSDK